MITSSRRQGIDVDLDGAAQVMVEQHGLGARGGEGGVDGAAQLASSRTISMARPPST
jgi:hypothetical protein